MLWFRLMPNATALLHSMHLAACSFAAGDEHLSARVDLTLQVGTRVFDNVTLDVKLTAGAPGSQALYEVSAPRGYNGPFDHSAMQECVSRYCREVLEHFAIGGLQPAAGLQRAPGAPSGSHLVLERRYEFTVDEQLATW
jgi:hypothetical protein